MIINSNDNTTTTSKIKYKKYWKQLFPYNNDDNK